MRLKHRLTVNTRYDAALLKTIETTTECVMVLQVIVGIVLVLMETVMVLVFLVIGLLLLVAFVKTTK